MCAHGEADKATLVYRALYQGIEAESTSFPVYSTNVRARKRCYGKRCFHWRQPPTCTNTVCERALFPGDVLRASGFSFLRASVFIGRPLNRKLRSNELRGEASVDPCTAFVVLYGSFNFCHRTCDRFVHVGKIFR